MNSAFTIADTNHKSSKLSKRLPKTLNVDYNFKSNYKMNINRGYKFACTSILSDKSLVDGMMMDAHGSPVEFQRLVSVLTQKSETTAEQDTADQKQEPEDKIIEDETMESGRVRFFQYFQSRDLYQIIMVCHLYCAFQCYMHSASFALTVRPSMQAWLHSSRPFKT